MFRQRIISNQLLIFEAIFTSKSKNTNSSVLASIFLQHLNARNNYTFINKNFIIIRSF